METVLTSFKNFRAGVHELKDCFGSDLHNVEIDTPCIVESFDLINAIDKFKKNEITKEVLLSWVNILWFTDLYEYCEDNEESISSVMSLLETLDEDGVVFSENQYNDMIEALKRNTQYVL